MTTVAVIDIDNAVVCIDLPTKTFVTATGASDDKWFDRVLSILRIDTGKRIHFT